MSQKQRLRQDELSRALVFCVGVSPTNYKGIILDESGLTNIVVFLLLVALNALIAMAHAALVNTRQTQLRERVEEGDKRAARVLSLVNATSKLSITYQLSLILLRFVIAAWVTGALIVPLVNGNPNLSPLLGYGLVLFSTACITLVLGEIVPEAIGSAHAPMLALWVVFPMRWLVLILSPVVKGLLVISRLFSSLFGSSQLINMVTTEEIMTLVDAGHSGGAIEDEEKDMIFSVLQLDQTVAREVMVPRIDIWAAEMETSLEDALNMFIEGGYSRIPIYEDNIDNIKGLLYAKDLLSVFRNGSTHRPTIRELMRPAYFVPENKRADELLKDLQKQKVHMAMVVDEYGGTAGLVTIENLIEEIVGDIVDEYDLREEAEYIEHTPTEYTVDASIDLDDFNDLLDADLPTEDSDTLGGFIYTYLGRVPLVGEKIETDTLVMVVESIEGRRIRKVHVTKHVPEYENEQAEETEESARPSSPRPTEEMPDQV